MRFSSRNSEIVFNFMWINILTIIPVIFSFSSQQVRRALVNNYSTITLSQIQRFSVSAKIIQINYAIATFLDFILSLCSSSGPNSNIQAIKGCKCGSQNIFVTRGSLYICDMEMLKTRPLKIPYATWQIKQDLQPLSVKGMEPDDLQHLVRVAVLLSHHKTHSGAQSY